MFSFKSKNSLRLHAFKRTHVVIKQKFNNSLKVKPIVSYFQRFLMLSKCLLLVNFQKKWKHFIFNKGMLHLSYYVLFPWAFRLCAKSMKVKYFSRIFKKEIGYLSGLSTLYCLKRVQKFVWKIEKEMCRCAIARCFIDGHP